jgi:lysophospholipase L1-like esterase
LIGDSISIGYTLPTRALLDGKANVHRIPVNGGSTTTGLAQLDKWLGNGHWDVIHFNWGQHDLKYVSPQGGITGPENGSQLVPPSEYARNLRDIVTRLKQTDAQLIFATTTPIPNRKGGRVHGDAVKYNQVALKVMKDHAVAINDLYTFIKPILEGNQRHGDIHFTAKGSAVLAGKVAGSISKALADATALHPTGEFDKLPVWPKARPTEWINLDVRPPPDAAARGKRFAERNNAAGIRQLCTALNNAIEPNAPQLEDFRSLVAQGRYAEALDAYRSYFFAKLKNPHEFGGFRQNLTGYQLKSKKSWVLMKIDPEIIDLAMQGIYTSYAVVDKKKVEVRGTVGEPGQMAWVPYAIQLPDGATFGRQGNDHSFWKTAKGVSTRYEIDFYRAVNKFPLDFMPLQTRLLESYALTGNREHLNRSCQIIDDWAMNARRDIDACSVDIRSATELESERLRDVPGMLRVMLDERPRLAAEFDSATLARLMLHLLSDFIPYTIRAKRSELANWGIMGIGNALQFATLFQEFKSMTYVRRELWRLWNINFTQYFTLDGGAYEASDTGHGRIAVPRSRECMPYALLPSVAGPLERHRYTDLLRDRMRYVTVQMTPQARQHPRFDPSYSSHPKYEWLESKWTTFDSVSAMKELLWDSDAEVRNRMQTVMRNKGRIDTALPPAVRSELAPYTGMSFIRESWAKEAEYFQLSDYQGSCGTLAMRYVAHKSVVFGREAGRYDLAKKDATLVTANAIAVDKKPGNYFHGWPKTGGKTIYTAQPGRTVHGRRFHSSDHFDFTESLQSHPYYRPPEGVRKDSHVFNLYNVIPGLDNTPIADIKTSRTVFALRGEGVYFVATRIENGSGVDREYSQFFVLPTWVNGNSPDAVAKTIKDLRDANHQLIVQDEKRGFLATSNLNRDNVSLYLAANEPLIFANAIDNKGKHVELPAQLDIMDAALAKPGIRGQTGKAFAKAWTRQLVRPVSVRWNGKGNQVFQTVVASRAAADELARPLSGGLRDYTITRGAGAVIGSAVTTRIGTRAWFQSGPEEQNSLTAGPVGAKAEALLATTRDGVTRGVVIGAAQLTIAGKAYDLISADAEFALAPDGRFTSTPIRRPIDTVRISPQQTVFAGSVDISFDIPTQDRDDIDYHYTLDGSDPTLDSPRYLRPFTLDRTAMVKVRPVRKGQTTTPWNFPSNDAGKTITAIFSKTSHKPTKTATGLTQGLQVEYLEGDWPDLMMNVGSDLLPVISKGTASAPFVPAEVASIRQTDATYALRYSGYIDVPTTGIYVFHAPAHLFDVTMDAGYDLRLWVDDEEWFPEPGLHAQNTWSVALKSGLHDIRISFVDLRHKTFRSEYWLPWQEGQVWQGMPTIHVNGPGVPKQPIPQAWLRSR